jgi:hypothetical protein
MSPSRSRFFTAAGLFVDCCPGATLSLAFGNAAMLVTFFCVVRLARLFIRVCILATARQCCGSSLLAAEAADSQHPLNAGRPEKFLLFKMAPGVPS